MKMKLAQLFLVLGLVATLGACGAPDAGKKTTPANTDTETPVPSEGEVMEESGEIPVPSEGEVMEEEGMMEESMETPEEGMMEENMETPEGGMIEEEGTN